jgi:ribonuclease HI
MGIHLHGRIRTHDTGPVITATDGSVAREPIALDGECTFPTGWGYLSSNGKWGVGYCPQPVPIAGRNRPLVAELRAIAHAAGNTDGPVEIWTDCYRVLEYLDDWTRGVYRMPTGYIGSRRHKPRLQLLAEAVHADPGRITARHVRGHRGQALNEAADRLAKLGRKWGEQQLTEAQVRARALWIAEQWTATGRLRDVAA